MNDKIPVNDEKHFIDCIIWLRDNVKEYAIRIEKVYEVFDWKWFEYKDPTTKENFYAIPDKDRIEKTIIRLIGSLSIYHKIFKNSTGGIEVGISKNHGPYIIFTYEVNDFSMCKESYYEEREE